MYTHVHVHTQTHTHTHTHTHLMSTLSFASHPTEFARLNKEMSTLMCGATSTTEASKRKVMVEGKM